MSRFNRLPWSRPSWMSFWRYGFAFLVIAATLTLSILITPHFTFPGTLYFCAVMLAVWVGGLGPGLFASVLSTLAFRYLLRHSLVPTLGELPEFIVVFLSNILIALVTGALRRGKESLRRTTGELKETVQNLLRTNEELQTESREREQAEKRLRRSDAYLTQTQTLTKTGSWAYDPISNKASYWSDEMFRIHGLNPQQGPPPSEEFLEHVHPEDRERVRDAMSNAVEEKREYEVEYRMILPNGAIAHIHALGHLVLNPFGDVIEVMGSAVDITERKLAEAALRRTETYLEEAQQISRTGSFGWEISSGGIYWSQETFRIFEFDPNGKVTLEMILERTHPEDRIAVQEIAERITQQRTAFDFEHRLLMPDGSVKYLHVLGHPSENESGRLEFVGAVTDVSERKRTEEALRHSEAYLAEAERLNRTGSWALRPPATKAHYWSDEMFRIVGFDPQHEIPDLQVLLDRIHPDDRDKSRQEAQHLSESQSTDSQGDYRIVMPDGTFKYVHFTSHAVFDAAGRVVEYIGTTADVTERKRAEEERERLRQLEADLAHTNRVSMMGELAAGLAHEIKQPISAAITNANTSLRWLSRDKPDLQEAREAIIRAANDGKRAAEIITRLRSFYTKGAPPRPELVDLNEVAREMLMLLRDEANRYSISMRTILAVDPPKVTADRVQLQQVCMNLMLNGIEAMKDTGGELSIRTELGQDRQLVISICDSGVGLPPEKTEQIFDAFYTTKPRGSGMGLSISRSIVESHGGRLWARSNRGRGATFHFTLPTSAGTAKMPATGT